MKLTDKKIQLFIQSIVLVLLIGLGTHYRCWTFVASILISISIFLIIKYNK